MNSTSSSNSASTKRYERYKTIVDCAQQHESFDLDSVKEACGDERPAFVTRVVGELQRDGWLVAEESDVPLTYRWNSGKGQFAASRWLDERVFGSQLKGLPEQGRPRERLLAEGVGSLRNSELLAILVRSGRPGESAVAAGEKLEQVYNDRLRDLSDAGRAELKAVSSAIEKTAYCQIMAGIELGRRVALELETAVLTKITSAIDAMAYCRKRFARLAADAKQEEFHIVTLDTKNQVINTHRVTVGTLDASLVHPREVFRPAIRDAAASVILVHNHPSGDTTPSPQDHAVTKRLESSGELLGVEVLDHIIVGKDSATSIRQS